MLSAFKAHTHLRIRPHESVVLVHVIEIELDHLSWTAAARGTSAKNGHDTTNRRVILSRRRLGFVFTRLLYLEQRHSPD